MANAPACDALCVGYLTEAAEESFNVPEGPFGFKAALDACRHAKEVVR